MEADKNVNWAESVSIYEEILTDSAHPNFKIKTFPKVQHWLLKARCFQSIQPGIFALAKLDRLGDAAFADGFLDFVTAWIVENARNERSPM
ncbi:MAG: hypothetical protein AAGH67_01800 [Cyanobacteria bacterium P01_H01_bin.162]